jgi:hypothetical protein
MNRIATAIAVASFALTAGFAQAQMSQGGAERPRMHEGMKAAHEACKDKPDRRACMTEQICSKSSDPKKCFEHAKQRGEHHAKRAEDRQKMHEACNGKRGDDLATCMKGQHQQKHAQRLEMRQKAHEACNGKRGEDLGKCLREQREKLGMGHHRRG